MHAVAHRAATELRFEDYDVAIITATARGRTSLIVNYRHWKEGIGAKSWKNSR